MMGQGNLGQFALGQVDGEFAITPIVTAVRNLKAILYQTRQIAAVLYK